MTIDELQAELNSFATEQQWEQFICDNLGEIRSLFYGLTSREIESIKFDYEKAFYRIVNTAVFRRRDARETPAIAALLVFFLAFWERARLWPLIQETGSHLPEGSLRTKAIAIYQYKYITNANTQYTERLETILGLLTPVWIAADDAGKRSCEGIMAEYFLDARLNCGDLGQRTASDLAIRMQNDDLRSSYPMLQSLQLDRYLHQSREELEAERSIARTVIVESLHDEACRLLPQPAVEYGEGDEELTQAVGAQLNTKLPEKLDELIANLGGRYEQLRQGVGTNWNADEDRNRIYLGTYLPRTIIESWNILSELLLQEEILKAFRSKERIRILDIGSGTGGAVIGALLAFRDAGLADVPVEITSWDANADALAKQNALITGIMRELPFPITCTTVEVMLPQQTESYTAALNDRIGSEGKTFDLVLCWKYLCEFYNRSYVNALGIIKNTLMEVSRTLSPNSIFIVTDVTAKDNGQEYFPIILNRESQQYLREPSATLRTILPIPCAKKHVECHAYRCFTQRHLNVSHRLRAIDTTRIAYRVLAPASFAERIVRAYSGHARYRVNAHARYEYCVVNPAAVAAEPACGYTAM